MGSTVPGPGYRAHESVLEFSDRTGAHSRNGGDEGRCVFRSVVKPRSDVGRPVRGGTGTTNTSTRDTAHGSILAEMILQRHEDELLLPADEDIGVGRQDERRARRRQGEAGVGGVERESVDR